MSRCLEIRQQFNILDEMGIPVKECGIQVYITEDQGKDKVVSLFNKVAAGMGEFLKEDAAQREQEKKEHTESPFDDGGAFGDEIGESKKGWFAL